MDISLLDQAEAHLDRVDYIRNTDNYWGDRDADSMRAVTTAQVRATMALAEAATRQAAALERIAAALEEPPKMSLDMNDAVIQIADKIKELAPVYAQ